MSDIRKNKWSKVVLELLIFAVGIAIAIPMGKWVAVQYKHYQDRPKSGDFQAYLSGKPDKLSVYGTRTCPACKMAREFLVREGIPFNDLRIDQDPVAKADWEALGQHSFPVFLTNRTLVVGFLEARLRELSQQVLAAAPGGPQSR